MQCWALDKRTALQEGLALGRGQREGGLEGESAKKISEGLLRAALSRLSPPGHNPLSLQPDQLRL